MDQTASGNCVDVVFQDLMQRWQLVRQPDSGVCQDIRRSSRHFAITISIQSVFPESPDLVELNSIEPPWYETRMPGGVTGTAREGLPMSIFVLYTESCRLKKHSYFSGINVEERPAIRAGLALGDALQMHHFHFFLDCWSCSIAGIWLTGRSHWRNRLWWTRDAPHPPRSAQLRYSGSGPWRKFNQPSLTVVLGPPC
jgi:hypothetical protein